MHPHLFMTKMTDDLESSEWPMKTITWIAYSIYTQAIIILLYYS